MEGFWNLLSGNDFYVRLTDSRIISLSQNKEITCLLSFALCDCPPLSQLAPLCHLACKHPCRPAFHCVKWFIAVSDKSGSVNIIIRIFFSNSKAWKPLLFLHTFRISIQWSLVLYKSFVIVNVRLIYVYMWMQILDEWNGPDVVMAMILKRCQAKV